jgi:hypothetical protein
MKTLLAVLIVAVMASPAQARFVDGNELYEQGKIYKQGKNNAAWGWYLGYVTGVADAREGEKVSVSPAGRAALPFCFPEGVTRGQVADVVLQYLEDNPKFRHLPASELVVGALFVAFPCN